MATATALATPAPSGPTVSRRAGSGPRVAPLRLAAPAVEVDLDLDAAARRAFAPHAVDDGPLAQVIALPVRRTVRPRWGRIAAIVLAIAVVMALAMGAVADADGPAPLGQTVTLQPGQTLWDVAVDATPAGQDPRQTLDQIRDLNGLTSSSIPAWTPIVLPAR